MTAQSKDLTSLCVGYMAELVAKRLVAVKGSHGDSNGKESALEDRGNTQDSPNHQPIKVHNINNITAHSEEMPLYSNLRLDQKPLNPL